MNIWFKKLWIGVSGFGLVSLVYGVLGLTSALTRLPDLVELLWLLVAGLPSLWLTALFILWLRKGVEPSTEWGYIGLVLGMGILVVVSVTLLRVAHPYGWLVPIVDRDSPSLTSDGLYEYQFELINMFQLTSRARLLLRVVSTGEQIIIPFPGLTRRIGAGYSTTHGFFKWVIMEPTDVPGRYIIDTQAGLVWPYEKHELDVGTRTLRRIE